MGVWNKTKKVSSSIFAPIKALTMRLFRKKKDPEVEVVEIDCSESSKGLEAPKQENEEQPQSKNENPEKEAKNE